MIVVTGEALIDMVPASCEGSPGFSPRPGGSPFNVAVGTARLEVPTAFLGRLSTDAFGQTLRDHLTDNGVSDRLVVDSDDPTPLAFVHPDEQGVASYSFYMEGTADRGLLGSDVPDDLAPRALHSGSIALVLEPIASTIEDTFSRSRDVTLTLDPNVRPQFIPDRAAYRDRLERLLRRAHVVKVSDEDLGWLDPDEDPLAVGRAWLALGPTLVVVTRGPRGAVALTHDAVVEVAGPDIDVADTVGAGDSFMSAALAWFAEGDRLEAVRDRAPDRDELDRLLRWAIAAAAVTCGRIGADPPTRRELDEALSSG